MDGVLANTEPLNQRAEELVCRKHGMVVPAHEWQLLKGLPNREVFKRLLQVAGFIASEETLNELIREKRAYFLQLCRAEGVREIPGAIALVRWAYQSFEKLGLVTSSGRSVQTEICSRLTLTDVFHTIITSDDVANHKPHPAPYLECALRLGVEPRNILVVEDSINGVESASLAGCFVVGLATSYPAQMLRIARADRVVNSHAELYDLFCRGVL